MQGVLRPGNTPDPNKDLDLAMLALNHGRERTETEFRALYDEAGLRLSRIIPTPLPSTLSVVEGVRG
jgi:hypothetical protein